MKRTPLYHELISAGAKMIPMADWEMPREISGLEQEHIGVRTNVGLFDFSMAGLLDIKGKDALALIQRLMVNDASRLHVNQIQYTAMCRPDGGMLSDLTVYRLGERHYLVYYAWSSVRGGQKVEHDWVMANRGDLDAHVTELSSRFAVLALQGPNSRRLLMEAGDPAIQNLRYFWTAQLTVASAPCIVSRTGYTGELGYEILVPTEYVWDVWSCLTNLGRNSGMVLCGLDSTYTLRLEKGYLMLYDYLSPVSPLEVGLQWMVKFEKGDFIGRDALLLQQRDGLRQKLVGIEMIDDVVPTRKSTLTSGGKILGKITSGAFSFSLKKNIGLGFVPPEFARPGQEVNVEVDSRPYAARIVAPPFYDPAGDRVRRN